MKTFKLELQITEDGRTTLIWPDPTLRGLDMVCQIRGGQLIADNGQGPIVDLTQVVNELKKRGEGLNLA